MISIENKMLEQIIKPSELEQFCHHPPVKAPSFLFNTIEKLDVSQIDRLRKMCNKIGTLQSTGFPVMKNRINLHRNSERYTTR